VVEFSIDLTIDPRSAGAGAEKVTKALEVAEQQARELRTELVAALSVRDAGTQQALRGIAQTLERTEERAIVTDARLSQLGKDITGKGVNNFADAIEGADRKAKGLELTLKRLFAGFSLFVVAREFQQTADLATNVQNRLRLVTEGERELIAVNQELFQVAAETRTTFEGTALVFTRLAASAKELGVTNQDLVRFTELLNKTIVLSGASAEESRAAMIQLSQGLASGALRGDELRSVLEQLPAVADVIAKSLGVTRGELRLLGQEGKITAEVILEAFKQSAEDIDRSFATTVPTIGQAFTVLQTRVIESVAAFDKASGASATFARGILVVAENADVLLDAVLGLGVAIGVKLAVEHVPRAIDALGKLKAAQIASAAAFAAAAFGVGLLANRLQELEENARGLEQADLAASVKGETLSAFALLNEQIDSTRRELDQLLKTFDQGGQTNEVAAARIRQLQAALAALQGESRAQIEAARSSAAATDRQAKSVQNLLKELDQEAQLLRLTSDERKVQEALIEAQNKVKKDDVDLSRETNAALQSEIEAKVRSNQAQARENDLLAKFATPAEQYKKTLVELEALHAKGKLSLEALTGARRKLAAELEKKEEKVEDPFEAQLKSLDKQIKQLEIREKFGGAIEQRKLAELDLEEKSGKLSAEQNLLLAERFTKIAGLNKLIADQKKDEQEIAKIRRQQELTPARIEALQREVDVVGELLRKEQELQAFRKTPEGQELGPEIDQAIEDLRLRGLEASEDLGAGFDRAFIKIKQEARDFAAVGDQVVNVFADRATDALVEFARTGELSFKQLASAILDDLTRILARMLVIQAINLALGGGGSLFSLGGGGTNPGAQHGATVQPGQRPRMVGEGGPELFVPSRTGTIVPNAKDVAQPQPPAPIVQVVNVASEGDVPRAIAGGGADEAIVNVIERNVDRIKARLG